MYRICLFMFVCVDMCGYSACERGARLMSETPKGCADRTVNAITDEGVLLIAALLTSRLRLQTPTASIRNTYKARVWVLIFDAR